MDAGIVGRILIETISARLMRIRKVKEVEITPRKEQLKLYIAPIQQ